MYVIIIAHFEYVKYFIQTFRNMRQNAIPTIARIYVHTYIIHINQTISGNDRSINFGTMMMIK